MQKKEFFISLLPALIGILFVIGVMTVFSACGMKDDGTWMRCHNVQNIVMIMGIVLTVIYIINAFVPNKIVKAILLVLAFGISVVTFLLPGIIMPMCMMHTMKCYTAFQPFVRIMTVILAMYDVYGVFKVFQKK